MAVRAVRSNLFHKQQPNVAESCTFEEFCESFSKCIEADGAEAAKDPENRAAAYRLFIDNVLNFKGSELTQEKLVEFAQQKFQEADKLGVWETAITYAKAKVARFRIQTEGLIQEAIQALNPSSSSNQ